MARIETKEVSGAEGPLGEAYQEIAEKRGSVANVFRIESLNPSVMRSHLDFYMKIMYGKSGLSRREREMIAVVVSSTNGCTYCTTHHTEALTVHLKGEADPEAIRRDFRTASITAKARRRHQDSVRWPTPTNEPTAEANASPVNGSEGDGPAG